MRISKRLDGTIEVVTDGKGLAKFLLGACLLLSGLAAYHFFAGPGHGEQFIGSIAAAALFLVVFLATYEHSRFVFRPKARLIDWQRRSLFSRQSGQERFDAVESVMAEAALDHEPTTGGGLSRRLVVRTRSTVIPFTRAYTGDPDGEMLRIAAQLNALFGGDPAAEIQDRIGELVAAGRDSAAARLLRVERGISLAAASQEVAQLKQSQSTGDAGAGTSRPDVAKCALSLPPAALSALGRNNKIEAIKILRQTKGLGLKEAADVVEQFLQANPSRRP